MPSFHNINLELEAMLEIAQGELTPEQQTELNEYIDELEGQAEDKIDNFGRWMKAQQARVDAIKSEANRLAAKARVMQNNIDNLKNHYLYTLDQLGKTKAEGKIYTIGKRKSVKCVVFDTSLIPEQYVTMTPKIEVAEIKAAIKNGENVPGAELRDSYSLSIK
jgi:hypothetical protein